MGEDKVYANIYSAKKRERMKGNNEWRGFTVEKHDFQDEMEGDVRTARIALALIVAVALGMVVTVLVNFPPIKP